MPDAPRFPSPFQDSDEHEDVHALRATFDVAETSVPFADGDIWLLHPANADTLISEEDFVRDERLPYWADIWPASHVLAKRLMSLQGDGQRLMELGCGLGLASIAAVRVGYDVLATDYYYDALRFARVNVFRNTSYEIATRMVDWRDFPSNLGQFDVVTASDVLYEPANADLIAAAIERTLAPGGVALISDPGRIAAPDFLIAAEEIGLWVTAEPPTTWTEGTITQKITIYAIRHGDENPARHRSTRKRRK